MNGAGFDGVRFGGDAGGNAGVEPGAKPGVNQRGNPGGGVGGHAWPAILDGLRAAVTRPQFEMWFRSFRLRDVSAGTATFTTPNSFSRDWIEGYFLDLLRRLVHEATGEAHAVRIVIDGGTPPEPARDATREEARPATGAWAENGATTARDPSGAARGPGAAGSTSSAPSNPRAGATTRGAGSSDKSLDDGHGDGGRHAELPQRSGGRSGGRHGGAARRQPDALRGQLFGHARYPNFLSDVILNDDYVFETFVAGPGNAMPLAAAQAVANAPGQAYNPLFLHGLVGLGKTHLLQAICHRVLARKPDQKILYLSCETFVNQFVASVGDGDMEDFRYRYRHVDMLLIDDIHFLASKERTQEEFFHTFNTLYNSKKQIVLSCDSPPREIPTLEERLVSRFKWGLVAELEAPDHETRICIVRRKAERRGIALPDGVAELIADNVATNVREIEGAILKVIGYATLSQRPLTREIAEEALRDIIQPKERKVSLETILRAVCEHYGAKASDIVGRRRHKSVSTPRQVCMYLARRLTDLSLVQIGGHLGGRDHTTVIYANDRIADEIEKNPRLREDCDAIVRKVRSGQ
ncbi:MAG: chromosomal replication initiator protein DnaA [Planctomycetes bacterium]|nr:chromosomal replication initiator protein DnaA [Planctomycetota bacterium]